MKRSFPIAAFLDILRGGPLFRTWMIALTIGAIAGCVAYFVQLRYGLIVTNMTDQVSWGAYIANFTFIGGVAAAAITVVVPAYGYRLLPFRKIAFVGESMAFTGMAMCLLFVTVDIGRPDRAWHLVPFWGSLNFPTSLLAWDVVILNGYLVINAAMLFFMLRARYLGRSPSRLYVPLVFGSMAWAIGIYLVEAFLYNWLGARPYWNAAIIAPRFIASAFVSGPALIVLTLRVMERALAFHVSDDVIRLYRRLVTVALLVDLFLFAAEVFTSLYGGAAHGAPMRFLLFGAHGNPGVRAYVWVGIALSLISTAVLLSPLRRRPWVFEAMCVLVVVAVWIEKGMALIVPGFVPTPLGEIADYVPSVVETFVSLGVWCMGLILFTVLLRLGVRIETGQLRATVEPAE